MILKKKIKKKKNNDIFFSMKLKMDNITPVGVLTQIDISRQSCSSLKMWLRNSKAKGEILGYKSQKYLNIEFFNYKK